MAEPRKKTQAKQQYRKPVIQKRRKLADVTESTDTIITGRID